MLESSLNVYDHNEKIALKFLFQLKCSTGLTTFFSGLK